MKTSVQVLLIALSAVLGSVVTYVLTAHRNSVKPSAIVNSSIPVVTVSNACDYDIVRQDGFKYIRPVQFIVRSKESAEFLPLKTNLQIVIDSCTRIGLIERASVYFRDFDRGHWMAINPDEEYHPGSLMKLPLMLTYLKMAEQHEGLLEMQLMNKFNPKSQPAQFYTSESIRDGEKYSIRELLSRMIRYSDNIATTLLLKHVDKSKYLKLFEDLNMDKPDLMDVNFTISPKEYATFLTSVYNGSYLTKEYSDFAVELMAGCDFEKGFAAGLPDSTPIAHKFGEWSDGKSIAQLHEAGIIYINGNAYELVVMTDGDRLQDLPMVISAIASAAYNTLDDPQLPDTTFPEVDYYSENR